MNSSNSSVRHRHEATVHRLLKARRSDVSKVAIIATSSIIQDAHKTFPPYTQYIFKLKSMDDTAQPNTNEWKLRKRYSQCYAFHVKLRQERTWDSDCLKEQELFRPLLHMLQQASGNGFPKKYVGLDTNDIIQERRRHLGDFVLTLLAAYTNLDVLLASCANEGVDLGPLLVDLEMFLEVPREQKELEVRLARSISMLKNVEITDHDAAECCICFDQSAPSDQTPQMQLLRARRSEVAKMTVTATATEKSGSTTAPYTQYAFNFQSSDRSLDWVLRKRYSQCHEFYLKLSQVIQCGWPTSWLLQYHDLFEPVTRMLEHVAGPDFPRKHARKDTQAIIHERCNKLADFLLTLLTAYADLEVLLGGSTYLLSDGIMDPHTLLVDIKRFLEIPWRWEATNAGLTQVALPCEDQEEETNTGQNDEKGDLVMVQLRCGHPFHDDCIIQWLRFKSTCPMCRQATESSGDN